jgi:hypothetical protein
LYCMVWENGILLISLHVSINRCKCNKSTADTIVVSLVQVKKWSSNLFNSVTRIKSCHFLRAETSSILSKRFVCWQYILAE